MTRRHFQLNVEIGNAGQIGHLKVWRLAITGSVTVPVRKMAWLRG
jgi:hypothetical protein